VDAGAEDARPRQDAQANADAAASDAGAPADAGAPSDAGGATDAGGGDASGPAARTTPTNGSAIAVSKDGRVAVAANRRADSIAILSLDLSASAPTATRAAEIAAPNAGEPWSVVIGNDDDTAFVILRKAQQIWKISNLHQAAAKTAQGDVGSEPSGIAISPTGQRLYVANWSEGTVSVLDAADLSLKRTIDLNGALATSGLLGASIATRPGLAHPVGIAVTNDGDGDDTDESIYVSEFFSQARTTTLSDDRAFDQNRQGVIYRIDAATENVAQLITLSPVKDTGFRDSNHNSTGCFPNQLYQLTIDHGRLYAVAVCASPRGPTGAVTVSGVTDNSNFKTLLHAGVFVVDTASNTELPAQGVLLDAKLQAAFDQDFGAGMSDDGAHRRMPLILRDIAFVPGQTKAYAAAYGSDAIFRIDYDSSGAFQQIGSAMHRYSALEATGHLPDGVAVLPGGAHALVLLEHSRNVAIVRLSDEAIQTSVRTAAMPTGATEIAINDGKRFFATGLDRWSFKGEAWSSCEACHPAGLTDNVTWFFARGPRQSISVDGTYASNLKRRITNWTGVFDEIHDLEQVARGVSGGVGAIVHQMSMPAVNADRIDFDGTTPVPQGQVATATPQAGLSGSARSLMPGGATMPSSVLDDWDAIDAYIAMVRSPRAPKGIDQSDIAAGRMLFESAGCGGCHGTELWSTSAVFYTPNEDNNNPTTGVLRAMTYSPDPSFPAALNPPSNNVDRSAKLRYASTSTVPATIAAQNGANDQIQCILRAVGTFPGTLDSSQNGVAPAGVRVREVRQNMSSIAQGASGFNPPSLIGVAHGAPYFHAGNARTLEELFEDLFLSHHAAYAPSFLEGADRATKLRQMIAFLSSIDDDAAAVSLPTNLGFDAQLCPAL
jgi:YVTN family beta-propeller protein